MKKIFGTVLSFLVFAVMPSIVFAEITFIPHIGFDVHKGIKNEKIDSQIGNMMKKFMPAEVPYEKIPFSRPLVPMFTLGLDLHFISHRSGFTFFWNNEFSFSQKFVAEEQLSASASVSLNDIKNINPNGNLEEQVKDFLSKHKNLDENRLKQLAKEGNTAELEKIVKDEVMKSLLEKKVGSFTEKQKMMFYATELLLGGTFRREKAFNIYFGIGLKLGFSINAIELVKDVRSGKMQDFKAIPDRFVAMVLPAFGGSLGFSYYFNRFIGISVSANDFLGLGAFVSTNILERHHGQPKEYEGYPTKAVAYTSIGLHNDFAMKFGVNIRFFGVKK